MDNPLSIFTIQSEQWKRKAVQRCGCWNGEAAEARFDGWGEGGGGRSVNLASNNYLGLTTHPKLPGSGIEPARKYGVGSGAVRTISGTMRLLHELERAHRGVQAGGCLRSCFSRVARTAGTVGGGSHAGRPHYFRELNHASIIDRGGRLSRRRSTFFRTKDAAARR